MLNHLWQRELGSKRAVCETLAKLVLTSDSHGGPEWRAMLFLGLLCSMLCGFNAGIVQSKKKTRVLLCVRGSECLPRHYLFS